MKSVDKELIEIVADDIRYLQQRWDGSASNHTLRRGSTVLRRFIVQNELQRAWKAADLGGQPEIYAFTVEDLLHAVTIEKIEFAASGGAHYQGAHIGRYYVLDESLLTEEEQTKVNALGLPLKVFKLQDFAKTPCIVAEGITIDRRTLIKYVANKLGGAHYDPKRNKRVFGVLDRASERFEYLDKNLVFFELLSIGQALAKAEDLNKLCEFVGL